MCREPRLEALWEYDAKLKGQPEIYACFKGGNNLFDHRYSLNRIWAFYRSKLKNYAAEF